ncbi:SLBB domain-containing protein [Rubrivirga sp. IMCC43871]|uniref:polysaccharide biosynthesis/export family protein n=1 Tax=Rubrivirga sp. IMCC43871 TaxID=3391575 RepID=UPI0039900CD7
MPLPVRGIVLPVLAAVCCLCASPDVAAQFIPSAGSASRVPTLNTQVRASSRASDDVVLAGPVDPETYLVGPGDVFVVSVGGGSVASPPHQTEAVVSADGLLVIAEAGTFRAAGRTLAAVRAEASAALNRQYRNVPTDVALVSPRRFAVYVSGAVPLPGRQIVTAVGRVEDAIARTTGDLNPLELADYETPPWYEVERRVALRNVRVVSRDGTERRVDLLRYYTTGDLAFNPLLADGDAVFVPTFDPTRESVTVSGDVDRPGYYDWRPDDTMAAVVAVAGGPGLAGAATVRRTRIVDGRPQSVVVPLAQAGTLDLGPRDQVTVLASEPNAGLAEVVGALAYPGVYPIVSGRTTLRTLVEAAGGLTPEALIRGAYLERTARSEPQSALDPLAFPSDEPLTVGTFDSTVTALGRLSDLGLVGRRYYIQEYVTTARLSADVAGALNGGAEIVLRDGDRLVVPRDLGVVRVFGQVAVPGYVPFDDGLTAADLIARAGGMGPAGTTIYTIDAATGRFTPGPNTPVGAGDAIFVDRPPTSDSPQFENLALQERREERDAERDRRQFLFQAITTTVSVVGTLLTAYVVFVQDRN